MAKTRGKGASKPPRQAFELSLGQDLDDACENARLILEYAHRSASAIWDAYVYHERPNSWIRSFRILKGLLLAGIAPADRILDYETSADFIRALDHSI